MTALSSTHRLRTTLIIAASVLVIGGIAAGTIYTLKHFSPIKLDKDSSQTAEKTPIEKASELFAKGDYAGAKSAYQNILQTYKDQNNEAGVKDIEMQLQIIEATAQSSKDPENTDKTRVGIGSQPQ